MSAAAGMRLGELRESYPQAREVVEELAHEQPVENRQILVLRGKRDGAIKYVFWNPIQGEIVRPIDEGMLWYSHRIQGTVAQYEGARRGGLGQRFGERCVYQAYARGSQCNADGRYHAQSNSTHGSSAAGQKRQARCSAAQIQAAEYPPPGRRPQPGFCQAELAV